MATFNIYGCCICRDLFGFVPENEHQIIHFLQSSSQITNFVLNTKPNRELTEKDMENVNMQNFKKKCIIHDYNKTLVDYYTKPSDFMIIDLINIANTNLRKETSEDGHEHYFTASLWFNRAFSRGLDAFFKNSKLESINRLDLIKEIGIEPILDGLIKWLKEDLHYKEEQIILIENKRTPYYVHKDRWYLFPPENRKKVNETIDALNNYFKSKCPNCHVIQMPLITYAVSSHPWSLTDLHYCQEFYNYLYSCVDTIAKNPNFCHQKLNDLRKEYSQYFCNKMNMYLRNTIVGKQLLNDDLSVQNNCYVADIGTEFYNDYECKNLIGKLTHCSTVTELTFPYSKIQEGYIKTDKCLKGVIGTAKNINSAWKTANKSTCIISNDHSIIIKHCGNDLKTQSNLIQTVIKDTDLADAIVTFSAWTKVHKLSNDREIGGTIALINSDNYNKGQFYKSKSFSNTEWTKISLTAQLPKKEDFNGLTVCLRANTGVGEDCQNAVVEFAKPKLEIGKIATDFD